MLKKIEALSIPNPSHIQTSYSIGFTSSTTIDIDISGGTFNPSDLSFSNIQQSGGGNFTFDAVLVGTLDFSTWHEEDELDFEGTGTRPPPPPRYISFDADFQIAFQFINLTVSVQMKLDANNTLALCITSATVTDKQVNFSQPGQTSLKNNDQINDRVGGMADTIASSFQNSLNSAFPVLPKSVKLTDDITYLVPGTPGGLVFPNDNGLQYCMVGQVQWKGTNAPGEIGSVPFPPVPTDGHDALFYINNYSFNALFWAFFKQGDLNFSFNVTNVPTSKTCLTTDYYKNTPLHAISDQYPNRNMIIDLTLKATPNTRLLPNEADITYNALVTFFVAKADSTTEKDAELFSIDLTAIDVLETFSVSTNASALTFHVITLKELSLKVVKSSIPDVDVSTLKKLWTSVLHPVYLNVLDKAGQAGIPLPSSLQGGFTNCVIQLYSGYVSAAVNLTST